MRNTRGRCWNETNWNVTDKICLAHYSNISKSSDVYGSLRFLGKHWCDEVSHWGSGWNKVHYSTVTVPLPICVYFLLWVSSGSTTKSSSDATVWCCLEGSSDGKSSRWQLGSADTYVSVLGLLLLVELITLNQNGGWSNKPSSVWWCIFIDLKVLNLKMEIWLHVFVTQATHTFATIPQDLCT